MSSPRVQYGYADGSANTVRLTSVTYPDGRVVTFDYGPAGGDDDRLSRVQAIRDGATTLAEYTYYGQANVIKTNYPEPATALDFKHGGTTGNPYGGCLDRFGRVIQNPWVKSGAPIAGATYQYDRASNRTQMQPLGYTADLQGYEYDGLQRLTRSVRKSDATLKAQEAWGLDATGNWGRYDVHDVATPAENLAQQRSANRANEITGITQTYGPSWPTPTYDRAGNTTSFPQPLNPTDGYAARYDAWNRLVEVKDGEDVVASYQYDGLNRRTTLTSSGSTRHFYYSSQWQVLEERVDASTSADRQFFWGIRYIDDLICRLTGSDRYYNCQDANWNTVAVLDSAGDVQQRYRYLAYGTPTRLNPDGSVASGSDSLNWETLYAGYRYDRATGLYQVRWRWLNSIIGRWITRDPIRDTRAIISQYAYARSNPFIFIDAFGLWEHVGAIGIKLTHVIPDDDENSLYYSSAVIKWYPPNKWIEGEKSKCPCTEVRLYQIAQTTQFPWPIYFWQLTDFSPWHFDPHHLINHKTGETNAEISDWHHSGYKNFGIAYEPHGEIGINPQYSRVKDDPGPKSSVRTIFQEFETCAVCIDRASPLYKKIFSCVQWSHFVDGIENSKTLRVSVSKRLISRNAVIRKQNDPGITIERTEGREPSPVFIQQIMPLLP